MSQRSKNLLEAFNQSKAPEKSAQPVAQPRGSTPKVGGPFADATPVARPRAEPRLSESRSTQEGSGSSSSRLRVALLCTLVALTFFFIGRVSAPSVQAAGQSAAAPGLASTGVPAVPAPPQSKPQSIKEALMDPANKATILANTYPFSADNQRVSQADSERLTQLGLPVTAYQDPEGKKQIYLLVGAKPKLSDLDKLLLSVKQAKFPTAHQASIDTYIKRSKH